MWIKIPHLHVPEVRYVLMLQQPLEGLLEPSGGDAYRIVAQADATCGVSGKESVRG